MPGKPGRVEHTGELILLPSSQMTLLLSLPHGFDALGGTLSLYVLFSGGQTIFSLAQLSRLEDPIAASLIQSFPQHRLESFVPTLLQDSSASWTALPAQDSWRPQVWSNEFIIQGGV